MGSVLSQLFKCDDQTHSPPVSPTPSLIDDTGKKADASATMNDRGDGHQGSSKACTGTTMATNRKPHVVIQIDDEPNEASYMEQWRLNNKSGDCELPEVGQARKEVSIKIDRLPQCDITDKHIDVVEVIIDKIEHSLKSSTDPCAICNDVPQHKSNKKKERMMSKKRKKIHPAKRSSCPHSDPNSDTYWLLPAFNVDWAHDEIQQYATKLREMLKKAVDDIPREVPNKSKWIHIIMKFQERCAEFEYFRIYHFLILSRRFRPKVHELNSLTSKRVSHDKCFRFKKSEWFDLLLVVNKKRPTVSRRSSKLQRYMSSSALKRRCMTQEPEIRYHTWNYIKEKYRWYFADKERLKTLLSQIMQIGELPYTFYVNTNSLDNDFYKCLKKLEETLDDDIARNTSAPNEHISYPINGRKLRPDRHAENTKKRQAMNGLIRKKIKSTVHDDLWSLIPPVVQKMDTVNKSLSTNIRKMLEVVFVNTDSLKSFKQEHGKKDRDVCQQIRRMNPLMRRVRKVLRESELYIKAMKNDSVNAQLIVALKSKLEKDVGQLTVDHGVFFENLETIVTERASKKSSDATSKEMKRLEPQQSPRFNWKTLMLSNQVNFEKIDDPLASYVHGHYDDFSLHGAKGRKGPRKADPTIKDKRRWNDHSMNATDQNGKLLRITKRQRKQMLKGKQLPNTTSA